MNLKGEAMLMSQSLTAAAEDWYLSIRRVNGKSDPKFNAYHDQQIAPSAIATFVPNWKSLEWNEIRESMFSRAESYAKDAEYKVNVAARAEGSSLSHEQVRSKFIEFMQGA
jgi:hypothetical protein